MKKLNIIHVPAFRYPSGWEPNSNQEFTNADRTACERWRRKWNIKLGFKGSVDSGDSPLAGGKPPFDFIRTGKALYKRTPKDKKFFYLRDGGGDNTPAVMCDCGGFQFILTYGCYECIATCPSCGLQEVIYSG